MRRGPLVLGAVAGAVLLASAGFLVGRTHVDHDDAGAIGEASVDAGFARDMAVHHEQAVLMASYARDHAPSAQIRMLAGTIATQQQLEVGQMHGWLDAWNLDRASDLPAMGWMSDMGGHSGHGSGSSMQGTAMPGMATPAELDDLVNLGGVPLEVRFLHLMIRHHQGGLAMADYAAKHARRSYVRNLARSMLLDQQRETDLMQNLLSERGGVALAR